MRKAVFLDRDGVINEDRDDYVKNLGELRVFPYAPKAIRRLNEAGYEVIVVSNQQGVAKGLISKPDLLAIQDEITRLVELAGGKIHGFYYCTHLAKENCACRKPKPGLILQAAQEQNIELKNSFMVGDTEKDVVAGKSAGCKTMLVLTGSLTQEQVAKLPCQPDFTARDLAEAADYITNLANADPE
ncbi:MAG: HAD family hydrolase [Armatimonadetes bacterium]|nr:HAD family hydrolase [Armatimonadota bacterium]